MNWLFFVSVVFTYLQYAVTIKCCDTLWDYYKLNGNCWDNPDTHFNQTEILQRWGATVTENYLTTKDGYIILLTTASFNKTQTTRILIGHGQHHNGDSFLTNFNKSLVYNLMKVGYEVSIINWRASKYSRGHVNLSFSDEDYWNFSFHEMGVYDLRIILSFVFNQTNEKSIYIGFSMGCTISYVYSSIYNKEAAYYLKGIISLGPFATMNKIRSLLRPGLLFWPVIRPFFKIIFGNYLPRIDIMVEFFAQTPERWYLLELIERCLLIGCDFEQIDPPYKPVQIANFDDIIPIGIFDHFSNIGIAKKFIQRSYGKKKNLEIYGTVQPPEYNLSNIIVPVHMVLGKGDYLGDPRDAIDLCANMANAPCENTYIKRDEWNHGDFIWAKDMVDLFVNLVIEEIKNMQ